MSFFNSFFISLETSLVIFFGLVVLIALGTHRNSTEEEKKNIIEVIKQLKSKNVGWRFDVHSPVHGSIAGEGGQDAQCH